jgi:hypothetical protein
MQPGGVSVGRVGGRGNKLIILYSITGQKRVTSNLSQPKLDGLKQIEVWFN